jgi:hypothetical protein
MVNRALQAAVWVALVPPLLWSAAAGAYVACVMWLVLGSAVRAGRWWRVFPRLVAVGVATAMEGGVALEQIGDRARAGELGVRDQVAVVAFDVGLAGVAAAAGFPAFAEETLLLALPFGEVCPEDVRTRLGLPIGARRHVFASDLPLRSVRVRREIRGWDLAAGTLGPSGPITWPASDYVDPRESNQAAAALNTPTTRIRGRATSDGRLDVVVELAVAYPESSRTPIGPFALEEGMFHDARAWLRPYCAEYRFTVAPDDPRLADPVPERGRLERASTALLRALR